MVTCMMTETVAYLLCSSLLVFFRPSCRGPMLRTPSVPIGHVNYNCQNVKDVNKNLPNGGTFLGHSFSPMRASFARISFNNLRNSWFSSIMPLCLPFVLLFFWSCGLQLLFPLRFLPLLEVVEVDVVLCCSLRCCIACARCCT